MRLGPLHFCDRMSTRRPREADVLSCPPPRVRTLRARSRAHTHEPDCIRRTAPTRKLGQTREEAAAARQARSVPVDAHGGP